MPIAVDFSGKKCGQIFQRWKGTRLLPDKFTRPVRLTTAAHASRLRPAPGIAGPIAVSLIQGQSNNRCWYTALSRKDAVVSGKEVWLPHSHLILLQIHFRPRLILTVGFEREAAVSLGNNPSANFHNARSIIARPHVSGAESSRRTVTPYHSSPAASGNLGNFM